MKIEIRKTLTNKNV